ncbi:molybdenum cofactor guanylyltransferase [Halalkalibacter kiskunsagensis]|uniref:Molybdenum cofactor guanylyltransferase n=1 Tax=Halalkalibacter kiskunsagensis TaxID=1548599 RepID=A0ABV6KE50_9BACI
MQLTGVILDSEIQKVDDDQLTSLLKIGDQTVIERQVRQMKKICDEVILVTNNPYVYLPILGNSIRVITDYYKGSGTLSGMHAAFSLAKNESLWIVTSDMPYVCAEIISYMLDVKNKTDIQIIAPEWRGNLHLYHGIYDRSCLDVTKELVENDQLGLMNILEKVTFKAINVEKLKVGDSNPFYFRIENKEDYQKVLQVEKNHVC